MTVFNTTYKFTNGIRAKFTIVYDLKNPIGNCEWSCKLNKKTMAQIMDEYVNKCVPFVYQQIADFIGGPILWVDKYGIYPTQRFEPKNKN